MPITCTRLARGVERLRPRCGVLTLTVQVDILNNNNAIGISDSGLPAYYDLAQFHFHWGSVNLVGSEHKIDGHAYPIEVRARIRYHRDALPQLTWRDQSVSPEFAACFTSINLMSLSCCTCRDRSDYTRCPKKDQDVFFVIWLIKPGRF